jgi:hypothetical protein
MQSRRSPQDETEPFVIELGELEPEASAAGEEAQNDAAPRKSEAYWERLKKLTLTSTMGAVSAGYAVKNNTVKAAGFGLFGIYHAEKAANDFQCKERWPAALHALNSVGTFAWAGGIGTGNRVLQTAGPGVNFFSHLASAGSRYYQSKRDWPRELIDAAEMLSFAVAGYTGSPAARAVAFCSTAAGFFADARKDKGLLGHGAGAIVWAFGAGFKNDVVQSIGAGVVAAAETGRFLYPVYEKYTQGRSAESTQKQPGSGPLLPVQGSPLPAESSPVAHVENPTITGPGELGNGPDGSASDQSVNPFASAVSQYVPHAPSRRPHSADGVVGRAASQPGVGQAQATLPVRVRRHTR